MGTKVAIHEIIQQAVSAENIELIDVPVPGGESIVLLRVKTMPEFAFVVWVKQDTGTLYQMRFKLTDGKLSSHYPIVCACCSSETHGLECPFDKSQEQEREAWKKELAERFSKALIETCQSNGIQAIFMRRADVWRGRYGDSGDLKIVEGKNYEHAYQYLYGRLTVRQTLEFIDRI